MCDLLYLRAVPHVLHSNSLGKNWKSFGFNELTVSNEMMKNHGGSKVEVQADFMREYCIELFEYWASKKDKRTY